MPAYEACTSPNREHGPPLARCVVCPTGPALAGVDRGHAGRQRLRGSVDQQRPVQVRAAVRRRRRTPWSRPVIRITDVHCRVTNAACPGGPGSDFVGRVLVRTSVQITDKFNGPASTESATVQELPIEIPVDCVAVTGSDG